MTRDSDVTYGHGKHVIQPARPTSYILQFSSKKWTDAVRLLSLPVWMGRHPKDLRSAFRCRTEIDIPTAGQGAHSHQQDMAIRWTKHTGCCEHAGGAASHSL
jgi:hypothetical protein